MAARVYTVRTRPSKCKEADSIPVLSVESIAATTKDVTVEYEMFIFVYATTAESHTIALRTIELLISERDAATVFPRPGWAASLVE